MNIPPEMFPPGSKFEDILRYNASRGEWGDGDPEPGRVEPPTSDTCAVH